MPVNLKLEEDGYPRNKTAVFQAVGLPTPKIINFRVKTGLEGVDGPGIEDYDWSDRPKPKTHRNMLITPIAQTKTNYPKILQCLKDKKDEGLCDNVMFDSGGYQVLTGSLVNRGIKDLTDLRHFNEEVYNKYDWADIYTMPDQPPNGLDTQDEFRRKQDKTIEECLAFYELLKPEVQEKVAPVFHLRTVQEIDYVYNAYKPILDKSKFASFSASGLTKPGTPRQLKGNSLRVLKELTDKLNPEGIGLHCLGIASPPAVFMLNYLGVRACDALTPIIGAGLGKIYFPYISGVSCSTMREDEHLNLDQGSLDNYKKETNHHCPFCVDADTLKKALGEAEVPGYLFRMLHNFIAMDELNWHYSDLNWDMLAKYAPNQYKDFREVVNDEQITFF